MFLRDVLTGLAATDIPYCIVGGVAVNLHGVPRLTYDVDLVVTPSAEALGRLEELLLGLGLRCRLPLRLADFAAADYRDRMRVERNLVAVTFTDPADPLREVDVLVVPPVDARALVARAVELDLDGTKVRIASLADLLALKRASDRAQDADDVAHLERILAEPADE